jgi:hypothetical protein
MGNAGRMTRTAEEYKKAKAALPADERSALVLLFERTGADSKPFAPRFCAVEAKGKEIKVRAVDYPIDGLLKQIAASVGKGVTIPPEVSGVVDFEQRKWIPADAAVDLLLLRHGLSARQDAKNVYVVMVRDPLYLSSLTERARAQKPAPSPDMVTEGIKTGYVIAGGCYIRPPYKVEVRTDDKQCTVCVNGIPVGRRRKLAVTVTPPIPEHKPFTLEQKGLLSAYVNQTYAKLMMQGNDHAAALKSIGRMLDAQKIVRSWKFDAKTNMVRIVFKDGDRWTAMLASPKEIKRAKNPPRAEETRTKALAEAQREQASVEQLLRAKGLLVATADGTTFTFGDKEAQEKRRAICQALQEALRQQEQIYDMLFKPMLGTRPDYAWQVFFNLRHRDLIQRMRAEAPK